MLVGREAQRALVCGAVDDARSGRSSTLLLVGEPGMGKTTLLDEAADRAADRGMRVVRLVGVELEQGVPDAGLEILLSLLGSSGADRSPTGLLRALAAASEQQPLVVLLDDVQWLDAQTLAAVSFASRRLLADPVTLLLAGRPVSSRIPALAVLPRLELPPLTRAESVALLRQRTPAMPVDTASSIAEAFAGVPLALVEVPALLPDDVLEGRAPLPAPLPVGWAVQNRYAHGFDALSPDGRAAAVLLACDSTGEPAVVAEALSTTRLSQAQLAEPEEAGLIRLTPSPAFVHPLARAAVHSAARPAEIRQAHALLGQVLGRRGDGPRALRHRAASVTPPDAALAAELAALGERLSAVPASRSEAAEVLLHAARFSSSPADRDQLTVMAAECGPAERALRLVAELQTRKLPAELQARCTLVQVQYEDFDDPREISRTLTALGELPLPPALRDSCDDALVSHAISTLDLGLIRAAGERIEQRCRTDGSWASLQAAGIAFAFVGDHRRAIPLLQRALADSASIDPAHLTLDELISWATIPGWLGTPDAEHAARFARMNQVLRATGQPEAVSIAAFFSSERARREGRWDEAEALLTEAIEVAAAAGREDLVGVARLACLQAYRGRESAVAELVARVREPLTQRSPWSALWLTVARGGVALSLARHEEVIAVLAPVRASPFVGRGARDAVAACLVDLAESQAALGDRPGAAETARDLAARLDGAADPLSHAFIARCRALAEPADADELFAAALADHAATREEFEQARTQLLLGEHLRRTRRPRESRAHIAAALETFTQVRAEPWIERARRELSAGGERLAPRGPRSDADLTPQETRVALAVVEGLTNAEVAQQLFLSVKTVEFHLGRVYRKLEVRSRGGLARALAKRGI